MAAAPGAVARALSAPSAFDFWRTAQRTLRGRYRRVLTITLLAALTGGYAGWSMGKRLYTATGLVRIASTLPAVMKETDQNRPMANFDGFMQAQREVMSGREVIDTALKEDSWQKLGTRRYTVPGETFASCLKVDTRARSDFLQIKFTHKDPTIAAAAVQSLIGAYKQVFVREQERAERPRMELLQRRRDTLAAEEAQLEAKIQAASQGRSLTEVESLCLEASERARKLRGALTDLQIAVAGGLDIMRPVPEPGLAGGDDALWYTALQDRLEHDLFEARARGLLPAHPTIARLENAIQASRVQIAALPKPDGTAPNPVASRSLKDRETSMRTLLDSAQVEVRQLASERERLKTLETDATALRLQLTETDSRLDALTTEASLGGRLAVVSGGDRPMTALLDNRTKMAAAGVAAGAVAPVGLLLLSAMVRRRYRSGEEVAEDLAEHVPIVAVLPEVDGPGALGMMAARCIHDIRARLQPHGPEEPRTYLVTSTSPGEGSSSLSLALAFSFAAAGVRTVLVDGDLTSRRVTGALDAEGAPGLIEATAGGEPNIQRIRSGPFVLTAGQSTSHDACKLVPAALRRVLAILRERFEVVIIDGDPVLTGITATVIAPQTDGVIFAVGSGQRPALVLQAVAQVRMQGTDLAVAVFNRADPSQLPIEVKDREAAAASKHRALPEKMRRLGPLVAAVLASLKHTREADVELAPAGLDLARSDTPLHTGDISHEAQDRRAQGRSAA